VDDDLKLFLDWLRANRGKQRPEKWYDLTIDLVYEYRSKYFPPLKGFLQFVDDSIDAIQFESEVEEDTIEALKRNLAEDIRVELDRLRGESEDFKQKRQQRELDKRYFQSAHILGLVYRGKMQ
jgi:hypothetical protein